MTTASWVEAPGAARDATCAGALHNMSSPPRSLAEIRPIRAGAHAAGERRGRGGPPESPTGGPSARLFARVHLPGLLFDGRSHEFVGTDPLTGLRGGTPWLAEALALLRTGRATGKARDAALAQCEALPFDAAHAEFLERVAALGDQGLPALLLARRPASGVVVPASARVAPRVALRLLVGTAGGLFVRARAPSAEHFLSGLPGAAAPWEAAFDYYVQEDA